KDQDGKERSLWLFFFTPIIPVSLFAAISILNLFFHWGFWLMVMVVVKLVVLVVASLFLGYFLVFVAGLVGRGLRAIWRALVPPPSAEELERRRQAERERNRERWKQKEAERARKEREKQERRQKEFAASYEGLQDVVCIGVPLKPKLELLPERRRTIHLRYKDLKVKVCKLYAR
ncbi:MAG: hypothetical protein Q8N81_04065, partial [bacterium]|nr:hypothetical protein [bacterium]